MSSRQKILLNFLRKKWQVYRALSFERYIFSSCTTRIVETYINTWIQTKAKTYKKISSLRFLLIFSCSHENLTLKKKLTKIFWKLHVDIRVSKLPKVSFQERLQFCITQCLLCFIRFHDCFPLIFHLSTLAGLFFSSISWTLRFLRSKGTKHYRHNVKGKENESHLNQDEKFYLCIWDY